MTNKKRFKITVSQDVSTTHYWSFIVEADTQEEAKKHIYDKMFSEEGDELEYADAVNDWRGDDYAEGMNRDIKVGEATEEDYDPEKDVVIKVPCKNSNITLKEENN